MNDTNDVRPGMGDSAIDERLSNCFANVFPGLSPDQLRSAGAGTLDAWDSVAHITLLTAIAEEFGMELEPEDYEKLNSYPRILSAVKAGKA